MVEVAVRGAAADAKDGQSVNLSRDAAEDWIRSLVTPEGPIEVAHERPWSTVLRVPLRHGQAWFKACGDVQAFEPTLTAALSARWPGLVPDVIGYVAGRAWLLLADAGAPLRELGNPPEAWLAVLPRYAELQRGETLHAGEHLAAGVPDLGVETLPVRYADLVASDLPLDAEEVSLLQGFAGRFADLCAELAARGVPATIQHDDLHWANVYVRGSHQRILDWGDSSISNPFMSLVVTFRFLEEINGLAPKDPWHDRLRDAYLEPWGAGLAATFELAMRVGVVAHAIAWLRQRTFLPVGATHDFDRGFSIILRRALRIAVRPDLGRSSCWR